MTFAYCFIRELKFVNQISTVLVNLADDEQQELQCILASVQMVICIYLLQVIHEYFEVFFLCFVGFLVLDVSEYFSQCLNECVFTDGFSDCFSEILSRV